jgi:hypothetical protein
MTLQLTRSKALAAMLALASCTTSVDPLEAKARDGDPAAACQLAARSLHSCALEKQKWEAGQLAARPVGIEQGIGEQREAYLAKADATLEGQQVNQILFGVTRIQLTTMELLLQLGPVEKVLASTEKLQQSCANLADRPKI